MEQKYVSMIILIQDFYVCVGDKKQETVNNVARKLDGWRGFYTQIVYLWVCHRGHNINKGMSGEHGR